MVQWKGDGMSSALLERWHVKCIARAMAVESALNGEPNVMM